MYIVYITMIIGPIIKSNDDWQMPLYDNNYSANP